jgi:UDP-N-acetylglucosamine:LPS N-acetylglucosamine transferase
MNAARPAPPVVDDERGPELAVVQAPAVAPAQGKSLRLLLVASSGGHLTTLYGLKPWWERHERRWVSFDKAHSRSLLAGERVAWAHHPTTRNIPNAARNLLLASRLLDSFRPDVVVTSGAGVGVPFIIAGRVRGCTTVFVEAFERVESPSLSGRLCSPFVDLMAIQLEEQRRFYPRGRLIGPVLAW